MGMLRIDLVTKFWSASGPTSCLFVIGDLKINEPKNFDFPLNRSWGGGGAEVFFIPNA